MMRPVNFGLVASMIRAARAMPLPVGGREVAVRDTYERAVPGPEPVRGVRTFRWDGTEDSHAPGVPFPGGPVMYFAGSHCRPGSLERIQQGRRALEGFLSSRVLLKVLSGTALGTMRRFLTARFESEVVFRPKRLPYFLALLKAIQGLIAHDSGWISLLVREMEKCLRGDSSVPAGKITRSLLMARHFLEKYRKKFVIEGPVFPFYSLNAGGERKIFQKLAMDLRRMRPRKVVFYSDGRYPLILGEEVNRHGTVSYERASRLFFLPSPDRWTGDSAADPEAVRYDVEQFFLRIENDLGLNGFQVMGRWGCGNYYAVRLGREPVHTSPLLLDDVLDRLGLDEEGKEEMRFLQARLRVSMELERNREAYGPFVLPATFILLWRYLSGRDEKEMDAALRRSGRFRGDYYRLEKGWVRPDEAALHEIMGLVGVPAGIQGDYAGALFRIFQRIDEGHSRPAEPRGAAGFPNSPWDLPLIEMKNDALRAEVRELVKRARARAGVMQFEFARNLGLRTHIVSCMETKDPRITGTTAEAYCRDLAGRGMPDEAARLRLLHAALRYQEDPVPDRGAARVVGRLLRYTRVWAGLPIEKAYGEGRDRVMLLRCERGEDRISQDDLTAMLGKIKEKGLFTAGDVKSCLAHVSSLYEQLGIGYRGEDRS